MSSFGTTTDLWGVDQLQLGDHMCLFYTTVAELLPVTAEYLASGLRRRERCLCVFADAELGALRDRLRGLGVAIESAEAEGRCLFRTDNVYLPNGTFDPECMLRVLGQEVERALHEGFSGLRAVGEMSWTLGENVDRDKVVAYEAMMNEFYPRSAAVGLCLYSLEKSPPDLIERVLHTHPEAIHNGHLCGNQFYQPPDVVLSREPLARVNWMLSKLQPRLTR